MVSKNGIPFIQIVLILVKCVADAIDDDPVVSAESKDAMAIVDQKMPEIEAFLDEVRHYEPPPHVYHQIFKKYTLKSAESGCTWGTTDLSRSNSIGTKWRNALSTWREFKSETSAQNKIGIKLKLLRRINRQIWERDQKLASLLKGMANESLALKNNANFEIQQRIKLDYTCNVMRELASREGMDLASIKPLSGSRPIKLYKLVAKLLVGWLGSKMRNSVCKRNRDQQNSERNRPKKTQTVLELLKTVVEYAEYGNGMTRWTKRQASQKRRRRKRDGGLVIAAVIGILALVVLGVIFFCMGGCDFCYTWCEPDVDFEAVQRRLDALRNP